MAKKNGNTPADKDPEGNPPAVPEGGDPKTVTISQDALNAQFAERADRAKKTAVGDLLQELGYADAEALKAVLSEYGEYKRAQQTTLEALEGDLGKATKRVTELEGAVQEAENRLESYMLRSAVQLAARSHGFVTEALDDIWLLVSDSEELFDLLKADTLALTVSGAEDVVKKVAELRPYWLSRGTSAGVPSGRGVSTPRPVTPKEPREPAPLVTF